MHILCDILYIISAWISNQMPSKVWDEITYPFPNFNGCPIEVCQWISNFIPHFMMDVITNPCMLLLTHWGRVTHICVGNLTIIGSDNGLSPGRRQAIIWTSAGILLFGPFGTNFSEILIGIQTFSFTKLHLKMLSAKWRPFYPGLNVLKFIPWSLVHAAPDWLNTLRPDKMATTLADKLSNTNSSRKMF